METDPVCGVKFALETAFATREHAGVTLYFCSQACVDKFDDDPHYYGHPDEHLRHEPHERRTD